MVIDIIQIRKIWHPVTATYRILVLYCNYMYHRESILVNSHLPHTPDNCDNSATEVSASISVTGAGKTFFWRGFCSPIGSLRIRGITTSNRGRGGNRPHPYNRGRESTGFRRK
jgi:hypothetical protein